MKLASHFSPYQQGAQAARGSARTAQGATDFLREHDKMAALLPTLTRMVALQKDCAATLPDMFAACTVLRFDSDELQLSVPNAALAAKLKQQLPKLQDALLKHGWQVSSIRLKVQVANIAEKSRSSSGLILSAQAVTTLALLDRWLEVSPRNMALKAALQTMISRHGGTK
jgi:hypothetical protein